MKKTLKIIGVVFAAIVIIWVGYSFYGRRYVASIGRLPEGTHIVIIDTKDKPSQSTILDQIPLDFGWPVPISYQKYAENFHWWLMDFHRSDKPSAPVREDKPTVAVVFDLPEEEVPALASFAGKVQIVSMMKSGDEQEIAEVELSNGEYIARYEYILGSTVKDGTEIQRGDIIGTIAITPRAVFPKENLGPWKKRDAIGGFTFQFSLFKIVEGNSREPVWITTESFTPPK